MKRTVYEKWLQVTRSNNGNVAILGAFALIMLVVGTGVAIDMSRMQTAKAQLYTCLDTAGLAAMAKVGFPPPGVSTDNWVMQSVKTYFLADCQSQYLQTSSVSFTLISNNSSTATASTNNVTVNLAPDNSTLTLDANLTEATEFMPVVGIRSVDITAHSVISRTTGGLELALALDNTGSMNGAVNPGNSSVSKIDAVKCAVAGDAAFGGGKQCEREGLVTTGLLDIIFNGQPTISNLFVGVIPFSDMVNVNVTKAPGSNFVNNTFPPPYSYKGPGGGCIDARDFNKASFTDAGIKLPSGDKIMLDISDDPPTPAAPPGKPYSTYFAPLPSTPPHSPWPSFCPAQISWMSPTKSDSVNAIQAMNANGDTTLNIGLAWGWRMLSPNWTGLWGGTPTFNGQQLPLPYNTPHMTKVVIFMTDGMNNTTNYDSAYEDLPSFDNPNAPTDDQLDQETRDVCDAMKSQGIIIYTIGFGQGNYDNPPTPADRANNLLVDVPLLQYCATQGNQQHFFLAPTNAELGTAFQSIANQLSNLVVSQ